MSHTSKLIVSFFTKNGSPETGLTPTIDIFEVTPSTNTQVVTGDSMIEVGLGFYKYNFTSYDVFKCFAIRADGGTGLTPFEQFQPAVNESFQDDIADAVWEEPDDEHDAGGITGTMGTVVNAMRKCMKNRTRIDKVAKTLTVFDDDGTTPFIVFDLKDGAGVKSIIEVCERDPQ